MDLSRTPEQDELRLAVADLLADLATEEAVRRTMLAADARDPDLWSQLVAMGLTGLAVPEALGGAGCGVTEVGIVAEEAGRALLASPWFSTVCLASTALVAAGDDRWLPGIADGSLTACLARGDLRLDGGRVSGTAPFVVDGTHADLVVALLEDAVVVVDGPAGVERTPLDTMDLTRRQARLTFDGASAQRVGDAAAVARTRDVAAVLLAAEQVGGAQWALETARRHALQRKQFGQPIGRFQAVKHMLADVLVEVETARSAVAAGLWTADNAPEDLPVVAAAAQAWCADTFTHATTTCLQVLGGIGFTWEHPAHLWFKRARADAVMLGSATEAREQLLQRLGV